MATTKLPKQPSSLRIDLVIGFDATGS